MMRALVVHPPTPDSAELVEVDEPSAEEGTILCRTIAVGVDGTDNEIVEGKYGESPAGRDRLILGHESLGRVVEAPAGSGFAQRHYEQGAAALANADRGWLEDVVTRWVPLPRWEEALERRPDDVKTVIELAAA